VARELLEKQSATKIQAGVRGMFARRRARLERAAREIQVRTSSLPCLGTCNCRWFSSQCMRVPHGVRAHCRHPCGVYGGQPSRTTTTTRVHPLPSSPTYLPSPWTVEVDDGLCMPVQKSLPYHSSPPRPRPPPSFPPPPHTQRVWRGYSVRVWVRETLHQMRVEAAEELAFNLIESCVKAGKAAVIRTRHAAATKIQSLARGHLTRNGYYVLRMRHARARSIQNMWASFRMYVTPLHCWWSSSSSSLYLLSLLFCHCC
jgi:hypothetical protein